MAKILLVLGVLAWFLAPVPVTQAANTKFTNEETSDQWLVLRSSYGWNKPFISLGPYEWTAKYNQLVGNTQTLFSTEYWTASEIVNCHKTQPPNQCRPGGPKQNLWLWGIGSESSNNLYTYQTIGSNDFTLNSSNNPNGGIGPAIAWGTGDEGQFGLFATGPYGWTLAKMDGNHDTGPTIAGVMIPLQWNVRGFYAPSGPPPAQPGE